MTVLEYIALEKEHAKHVIHRYREEGNRVSIHQLKNRKCLSCRMPFISRNIFENSHYCDKCKTKMNTSAVTGRARTL